MGVLDKAKYINQNAVDNADTGSPILNIDLSAEAAKNGLKNNQLFSAMTQNLTSVGATIPQTAQASFELMNERSYEAAISSTADSLVAQNSSEARLDEISQQAESESALKDQAAQAAAEEYEDARAALDTAIKNGATPEEIESLETATDEAAEALMKQNVLLPKLRRRTLRQRTRFKI